MKFEAGPDSRRNVGGRPIGAKNKRTLIREALETEFDGGEIGFWRAAAQQAKEGDGQAMSLIANRLVPALKPEMSHVEVELPTGDASAVAKGLIEMSVAGELSPDQLASLMSSLSVGLKIEEVTLLEERVAALEKKNET